jgi:hypothetical protein
LTDTQNLRDYHNKGHKQQQEIMVLSPTDVMTMGLKYCGIDYFRTSAAANTKQFQKHYGSSPLDFAEMWYDLTTTDIPGA